ncbi:hypothetical protein PMIN01_08055 [Paraphaeosphaeria minitans]|uniref:DDE-1 domain-containing protein n=1 Tax=Paraphaeosphaeria minitans TaxID=565426 RepID=A0A9P6GDG9_9PLEO|nr:hypothetical protein PMIN01_08055 [Paraphaeosphaeria minitans]
MPGLQAALAEIRNLKPGDKPVYTNIAEKHGVSRTTLSRAHRGVQVPRHVEDTSPRAGSHASCTVTASRHNAESGYKYKLYFDLLQQKITEYNIEPAHTYNMDEKGFAIGLLGRTKRIFSWTNNDIGLAWLEQVFDRYTKAKARRSYRLLIVDGHGSHLTQDFIDYCDQNRIILAVLPPHSTQTLQPLDVVCFKPLSSAYASELDDYLQKSQGLSPLTRGDFVSLFWPAWVNTFTEKLVQNSFTATGISPINPDVILDRFGHTTPIDSDSVASGSTAYSAEDWLRACTTLRAEVKDPRSAGARKLGQTIHHLSTQVELLHNELDGLRQIYQNQKRQKQPSRQLDLQQHQEYHGGAMVWSPRAIREARVRKAVTEQEKEEEELKKAKMKELAAANKLYKEKIEEERRQARVKEKEERARMKAEERRAIDARKAARAAVKQARDSTKAMQQSQRGKSISSTGACASWCGCA